MTSLLTCAQTLQTHITSHTQKPMAPIEGQDLDQKIFLGFVLGVLQFANNYWTMQMFPTIQWLDNTVPKTSDCCTMPKKR